LREDNADLRLREHGRKFGLVEDQDWQRFQQKKQKIQSLLEALRQTRLFPKPEMNQLLQQLNTPSLEQ
ncbi:MAG TPA: tRNA uridine-5-carboxymethylaminomethyl(34) synthesis enzyme MnmG, partial [Deltaproteobacteria bacterium]|nr:tRNA uridine-5-carboxymethylaminomethyl(34) synthesis enzyme MnmG [Deltaproteobacteria bacterium]